MTVPTFNEFLKELSKRRKTLRKNLERILTFGGLISKLYAIWLLPELMGRNAIPILCKEANSSNPLLRVAAIKSLLQLNTSCKEYDPIKELFNIINKCIYIDAIRLIIYSTHEINKELSKIILLAIRRNKTCPEFIREMATKRLIELGINTEKIEEKTEYNKLIDKLTNKGAHAAKIIREPPSISTNLIHIKELKSILENISRQLDKIKTQISPSKKEHHVPSLFEIKNYLNLPEYIDKILIIHDQLSKTKQKILNEIQRGHSIAIIGDFGIGKSVLQYLLTESLIREGKNIAICGENADIIIAKSGKDLKQYKSFDKIIIGEIRKHLIWRQEIPTNIKTYNLDPLPKEKIEELINNICKTLQITPPEEIKQEIADRSLGIPMYPYLMLKTLQKEKIYDINTLEEKALLQYLDQILQEIFISKDAPRTGARILITTLHILAQRKKMSEKEYEKTITSITNTLTKKGIDKPNEILTKEVEALLTRKKGQVYFKYNTLRKIFLTKTKSKLHEIINQIIKLTITKIHI